MGLLNRRITVCIECGKEFRTSSEMPALCNNCHKKNLTSKEKIQGYIDYRKRAILKSLNSKELRAIPVHIKHILEKYNKQNSESINKRFTSALGASFTDNFFTLNQYDYTLIDSKDVIAVGYRNDFILTENAHYVFFVVFTKDPYIPVFPLAFECSNDLNDGEIIQKYVVLFESLCPYLLTKISDLDTIKRFIQQEDSIGNREESFMVDKIIEAEGNYGLFNMQRLTSEISDKSMGLFREYGYTLDR